MQFIFDSKHTLKYTLALLILFLSSKNLYALEKILNYNVELYVNEDSSLKVIETIKVRAEGNKIKRGIFRDFPTKYKTISGLKYSVGFKIDQIKKDGKTEPYHLEKQSNGIRIYIGQKDVFLNSGVYTYTLAFSTTRQLGFFEKHDEIYFNAIGHGWDFGIDFAKVIVNLPRSVSEQDLRIDAYTGTQGSVEQNYKYRILTSNSTEFKTTQALAPKEGFTVVVGFPKGIVRQPTKLENFISNLIDNLLAIIAFLISITASLMLYYFWKKHGRDPKSGVIYPRFEAPKGLLPFALPYLENMGFQAKCLASAIVDLACKNKLKISEESGLLGFGTKITLEKLNASNAYLTATEEEILKDLFPYSDTLTCAQKNYQIFQSAIKSLTSDLKNQLGSNFKRNTGLAIAGFPLQILGLFVLLGGGYEFIIIPYVLISLIPSIFFAIIMKSYTKAGRALMDEIEGYKLYLTTAEKGHYDNIIFPELNVEKFEYHLPYAVALGCEAKWMTALRNALEKAGKDFDTYSPAYYTGHTPFSQSKSFGTGGFSQSIASSSTAPGSSSGSSSSGGSSGGGGGGGGGGGW